MGSTNSHESPELLENVGEDSNYELRQYFATGYQCGELYEGSSYQHACCNETIVLQHKKSKIIVWAYALDVRKDKKTPGCVIFHYAPETAFHQITAGSNLAFKLWASKAAEIDANFGFGLYGTSKEPAQWSSVDEILLNNYWPKQEELPSGTDETRDLKQHLGKSVHLYIKQKFEGRTDYCIPVICDAEQAYNIQVRATPEMRAGPGKNRFGGNEPIWRDVWVVRVDGGSDLVQASEDIVKVMERQIQCSVKRLGPKHPETLGIVNNLANLLRARGRLDEAEPLYREALEGSREKLGPKHPETLASINNLAGLLRARGRLDEAEPLFREALEGSREKLGPEHPQTLTSISNLAALVIAASCCALLIVTYSPSSIMEDLDTSNPIC